LRFSPSTSSNPFLGGIRIESIARCWLYMIRKVGSIRAGTIPRTTCTYNLSWGELAIFDTCR
jgi:hypothetical protein